MEITFHARYTDGRSRFEGLDHYDGAQSLLGLSQIMLIALNSFLNREILVQAPSAKGFRLILGRSKEGSWDQAIHMLITNPDVLKVAEDIGKSGLYDLRKWALLSGVGIRHVVANRKAKKIVRELEQKNQDLHEKLDEALKRVHYPVKHQGLTIQVMAGRQNLATFNEATLRYIETEVVHEAERFEHFAVSRLNARTGTGRFIPDINAASVPFAPVDSLSRAAKQALGDSLAYLIRERFVPVNALISEVTSADGHLKSYRLHSVTPV